MAGKLFPQVFPYNQLRISYLHERLTVEEMKIEQKIAQVRGKRELALFLLDSSQNMFQEKACNIPRNR